MWIIKCLTLINPAVSQMIADGEGSRHATRGILPASNLNLAGNHHTWPTLLERGSCNPGHHLPPKALPVE